MVRSVYAFISLAAIAALSTLALYLLFEVSWRKFFLILLVLAPSLLFFKAKDRVPLLFVALFALTALFNGAGMNWSLYSKFFFYDEVSHFFTALAIAPCAAFLFLRPILNSFKGRGFLFALAVFIFGLAIGAAWEVFEFVAGISSSYSDTISDLILDGLGAACGGALAALWMDMKHFQK